MFCRHALVLVAALLLPTTLHADLTNYSQDFQGLSLSDPAALSSDGWSFFVNAFQPNGDYAGGYGDAAPNGPQISALSDDGNGNQYLNVYSDYNNGDQGPPNNFLLETNVYQQQTIGAADLNTTITFDFDYRAADDPFQPSGGTTTFAFIKVFDPAFNLLDIQLLETTNASMVFTSGSLSQLIDPNWTDAILQFGFLSNVTNFEPSGVYYDNVNFGLAAAIPEPGSLALLGLASIGWLTRRRRV